MTGASRWPMRSGTALGPVMIGALLAGAAHAQAPAVSNQQVWEAGTRLYTDRSYAEAASAFQSLVDRGVRRTDVYFNLGSAWFRQGDLGRAVLNFERSALLAPRDRDVRASLEFVRAKAEAAAEGADLSGPPDWTAVLRHRLAPDELAILSLVGWWLCAVGWIAARHRHWGRARVGVQYAAALAGLAAIASLGTWGAWAYTARTWPAGIVVAPTVAVTTAPGPAAHTTVAATLHAGAAVRMVDARDDWLRVSWGTDSREGWVPEASVERIEDG